MLNQTEMLEIIKAGWDDVADQYFGVLALPKYGPYEPTPCTDGARLTTDDRALASASQCRDLRCRPVRVIGDHERLP